MVRSLKLTIRAQAGVVRIARYIASHFGPDRAEEFLKEFDEHVQSIRLNPERYPTEPYGPKSKPLKRSIFQNRTILFFRYTRSTVTITVVHAAKTDWKMG